MNEAHTMNQSNDQQFSEDMAQALQLHEAMQRNSEENIVVENAGALALYLALEEQSMRAQLPVNERAAYDEANALVEAGRAEAVNAMFMPAEQRAAYESSEAVISRRKAMGVTDRYWTEYRAQQQAMQMRQEQDLVEQQHRDNSATAANKEKAPASR